MRRTLVAGNWKMFGSRQLVRDVIGELRAMTHGVAEIVICPPYPYLGPAADMVAGSALSISPLAAQVPYAVSEGSIQNAGQSPWPIGILARISMRPKVQSPLPRERIRADV